MPLLVRLTAIVLIASFVITLVIVARQELTKADQSISPIGNSWAELTSQNSKPVVKYDLEDGDALVIRFGQVDLRSCALVVIEGPRTGRESTTAGVNVVYAIVSADIARDRAEFMADACVEAWISNR